jgi:hypothetical protein
MGLQVAKEKKPRKKREKRPKDNEDIITSSRSPTPLNNEEEDSSGDEQKWDPLAEEVYVSSKVVLSQPALGHSLNVTEIPQSIDHQLLMPLSQEPTQVHMGMSLFETQGSLVEEEIFSNRSGRRIVESDEESGTNNQFDDQFDDEEDRENQPETGVRKQIIGSDDEEETFSAPVKKKAIIDEDE